jgi:hypothetical protein
VVGWVEVVVPELMPPMLVVGEVFPIGGVVPVVVLGVVPLVVFGVVPVVVFGVVPVVVLGVAPVVVVVVVLGTLLVALGGQTVLPPAVLGDEPGMVALGLFVDGLDVLAIGEVEVTGHEAEEVDRVVGVVAGLVLCVPVVAPVALVDCEPGTTGVGWMAPVDGDVVCASAMPTAKQSTAATRIARVLIKDVSCRIFRWDVARFNRDAPTRVQRGASYRRKRGGKCRVTKPSTSIQAIRK